MVNKMWYSWIRCGLLLRSLYYLHKLILSKKYLRINEIKKYPKSQQCMRGRIGHLRRGHFSYVPDTNCANFLQKLLDLSNALFDFIQSSTTQILRHSTARVRGHFLLKITMYGALVLENSSIFWPCLLPLTERQSSELV